MDGWFSGPEAGVNRGGAVVRPPSGEEREVRVPAGEARSSTRAELIALMAALRAVAELTTDPDLPVVVCTDSQAALRLLSDGPAAQCSFLGAAVWRALLELRGGNRRIHLQWVPLPAHCELPGNNRAGHPGGRGRGAATGGRRGRRSHPGGRCSPGSRPTLAVGVAARII